MSTQKVILFLSIIFFSCSVSAAEDSKPPFPHQLLKLDNGEIVHTRTQAGNGGPVKILLLSGPTDHWHSDSGWFSLLQPMLSTRKLHNMAIDRPGFGTRDKQAKKPPMPRGFGSLGALLDEVIDKSILTKSPLQIIVVAYASSNLSIWPWLKSTKYLDNLRGIILIDPDVLLHHSIAQYKSDAAPYRDNYQAYLDYVESGKYQERTNQIIDYERKHLLKLLPEFSQMDWDYYNKVEKWRGGIQGQLHKVDEVSAYAEDLDTAYDSGDPDKVPLYVIDTDFESRFISNSTDNPEVMEGLVKWQQEGTAWFKSLAENSDGEYFELANADHLVMMQNPELIVDIIEKILIQKK